MVRSRLEMVVSEVFSKMKLKTLEDISFQMGMKKARIRAAAVKAIKAGMSLKEFVNLREVDLE